VNLANSIGSDEMQIVHDQTVDRIAELMYMGEIPMPRNNAEYSKLISVEIKHVDAAMFENATHFIAMIPSGQNLYAVYSHTMSRTEIEAFDSYAECMQHGVRKVVEEAEEIIDLAVAEAHTKFRERLCVPPLFLLITKKKTVKSLYKWLTDNTTITEGIIAGIISLTENMPDEENEMCFLRIEHERVIPLTNSSFTCSRGVVFDFTPILNFASSFLRENIPAQDSVIRYHKHKQLVERYGK